MIELNLLPRTKARYHRTRNSLFSPPKSWRLSQYPHEPSFQLLDTHPSSPTPQYQCASALDTCVSPKSNSSDTSVLRKVFRRHTAPSPPPIVVFVEQRYHHVPVNAASGFVSSTTTGKVLDATVVERRERAVNQAEVVDERQVADLQENRREGENEGDMRRGTRRESGGNWWDEKRLVGVVEDWRTSMGEGDGKGGVLG